jgi:hypothetical protein
MCSEPGRLTVLASARPEDAAVIIDRLGRYSETAATWGPYRIAEVAKPPVRERVLVADHEADLFAGPLREVVAGRARAGHAHAAELRVLADTLIDYREEFLLLVDGEPARRELALNIDSAGTLMNSRHPSQDFCTAMNTRYDSDAPPSRVTGVSRMPGSCMPTLPIRVDAVGSVLQRGEEGIAKVRGRVREHPLVRS